MNSRYRVMPRCIGQHEPGNAVCDGEKARPACIHKSTCEALQWHTSKNNTKPTDYIRLAKDKLGNVYAKPLGEQRFEKVIEKANLEKPIIRNKHLAPSSKKIKKKKKRKTYSSQFSGNRKILDEWFDEFLSLLARATQRTVARLPVEAFPGELFLKDYRDNPDSSIVSVFVRGTPYRKSNGVDFPVVQVKYRIREVKMDVRYPITQEQFKGIDCKRMAWIKPIPLFQHQEKYTAAGFKSKSLSLTRPQFRMCAEIVIDLINREVIKTPVQ